MRTRVGLVAVVMLVAATTVVGAEEKAGADDVVVTIKELDVEDTVIEFRQFEKQLEKHRAAVSEGQKEAAEIAAILDELRRTASAENDHNEEPILDALDGFVTGVIGKQSSLVDFLQSQRYRITYYANKMAASVRPEDIANLFGTEKGNLTHLRQRTRQLSEASRDIAEFIDGLSPREFDKKSFQRLPGMSTDKRQHLARLELRYQEASNVLEISKSRLRLVREAARATSSAGDKLDLNVDLLLSQMFGTLDRIRLQMSRDLLYLETFLTRYEQSARTEEILKALSHLVSLQGGLEEPSPGLANVLEWLEDSSVRKISLGMERLEERGGGSFTRSSDLLRQAYSKGRGSGERRESPQEGR